MENINTDTNKIEEFITSFSKDIVDYRNNIAELYRLINKLISLLFNLFILTEKFEQND